MTSSEEHNFENNWREAFDNADETPLLSVWERVEARLDEEDDRVAIIPLWQQWQTLKWVAAAGGNNFIGFFGRMVVVQSKWGKNTFSD
jgi:hypothetical protein